jgi:hypothetical protein
VPKRGLRLDVKDYDHIVRHRFDGDRAAFKIQPTTHTLDPPFGDIRGDKLVLRIEGTERY